MTEVTVLTLMMLLKKLVAECKDGVVRARAGVYKCVYLCGPWSNCMKAKAVIQEPPSPSATSPKVCLFQSWQQWRKGAGEKGNDCFTGRHWSIVNAACSFSWPVTCIVVGFLIWGGQTAGGTAGGWWTAGPIWEREKERRVRACEGGMREGKGGTE